MRQLWWSIWCLKLASDTRVLEMFLAVWLLLVAIQVWTDRHERFHRAGEERWSCRWLGV